MQQNDLATHHCPRKKGEYPSPVSCVANGAACNVSTPDSFQGGGNPEVDSLPNGMVMSYYDFTPEQNLTYDFNVTGNIVQFCGVLSGKIRLKNHDSGKNEDIVMSRSQEAIIHFSHVSGLSNILKGDRIRMFAMFFSDDLLIELLEDLGECRRILDASWRNRNGVVSLHKKTLSPSFKMLISQLLQCPLHGGIRRLYLEGKALEILALQLAQLTQAFPSETALSRSDIERLHAAKEFLCTRMDDPPSLRQLAAMTCLNEFKLKKGFREIFGTTVYGVLREYRMETARSMLLNSDMTVGTVAATIGYTNISHFIAAFQARYGITPGTMVKQSRRSYPRI